MIFTQFYPWVKPTLLPTFTQFYPTGFTQWVKRTMPTLIVIHCTYLGLEMFVSDTCGYNNKCIYALRSWSTLPINIKDPHVKQHPAPRALHGGSGVTIEPHRHWTGAWRLLRRTESASDARCEQQQDCCELIAVNPEVWSRHGTGQFNRLYSSVIDWSKANKARDQRVDEVDDGNNSASTPPGSRQLKIAGDENKRGNDRNKTTAPGKFSYKLYSWSAISLYLVAVTGLFIFCHCCIRLCVLWYLLTRVCN